MQERIKIVGSTKTELRLIKIHMEECRYAGFYSKMCFVLAGKGPSFKKKKGF